MPSKSPPPISGARGGPGSTMSSLPASSEDGSVSYVKIEASSQLEEEFRLGETLGEGAFGHVLLATRRRDGEKFAVKKLAKNKDTRSTYGKSWENEIRVLRRLRHPNIVQLEIIYESEDNCYLFMELCDAGTLSDELDRRGRFEETDARCLLRQVGSALSFLHKSRVVHRDLKLQNCLLRTNRGGDSRPGKQQQHRRQFRGRDCLSESCPFVVKLTDFGLSIELRSMEHALVDNVGTPVYQAPEIVSGSSYTVKADVWALGVLAFCMLHGRSPYGDIDPADLPDAVKSFDYAVACADCEICAGLSRRCRGGLRRLLLSCQVERWSAAEFMDSAWANGEASDDGADEGGDGDGDGDGGGGGILELMRSVNKANNNNNNTNTNSMNNGSESPSAAV